MGVKRCDRLGCENIMCEKYIYDHYICLDCLYEFKDNNDGNKSEKEFIRLFKEFMDSDKTKGSNKIISLEEFLGC